MHLLYKLGGEYSDLADHLWSTEVNILTDHGLDSGLARCVLENTTRRILQQNSSYDAGIESFCRFFKTPEIEKKGRTVLRGMGAWSYFVNQRSIPSQDSIWNDLKSETLQLLDEGLSDIFQHFQGRLPKFEAAHKDTIKGVLVQLLHRKFTSWYVLYVLSHMGPLVSPDKDPPSDLVAAILEEISLEDHAQVVSEEISRAFWDVVCMAVHPELFDYPTETGGHGVRKTTWTSTAIAPSRLASLEGTFPLLVAALWTTGFAGFREQTQYSEEVPYSNGTSAGESECAEDPLP
jgi:hypothetical protein